MKSYTTKEVCNISGLDRTTIFRWEEEKVILAPERDRHNHRKYSEEILQEIMRLSGKNRHEIYAIVNQKGGVGKTTITINIAACLAKCNQKVLVMDLDSQSSLTYGFGLTIGAAEKNTYHLLTDDNVSVADIVKPTSFSSLSVAPANIILANADFDLRQIVMGETILKTKLEEARKDYNYILIDCPPNLGPTVGAGVLAADAIIVPIQLQEFSLIGLQQLMIFLKLIFKRTKNKVNVYLLPNMVDNRFSLANNLLEELKKNFEGKILPQINTCVTIADSQHYRQPIITYNNSCRGAKDFKKLTDYIMKEVKPAVPS